MAPEYECRYTPTPLPGGKQPRRMDDADYGNRLGPHSYTRVSFSSPSSAWLYDSVTASTFILYKTLSLSSSLASSSLIHCIPAMAVFIHCILAALLLFDFVAGGRWDSAIRMPIEEEEDEVGTRWAVLVAGSSGYANYRHQVNRSCYLID